MVSEEGESANVPSTDAPSMPERQAGAAVTSSRARSRLIALGSAAVLAVYAAGYDRTRAAALQFARDDAPRRAPAHAFEPAAQDPAARSQQDSAVSARATSTLAHTPANGTTHPGVHHADSAPPGEVAKRSATETAISKPSVAAAATTNQSPAAAAATKPTMDIGAAMKQTDSAAVPPAPRAADAAADAPHAAVAEWKDGSYSGWGTSRHGDIQATVVVADGRIAAASITQCLTRYSCSWIAALPPQVVSRQSAEVDYVSGATQSSNAFYSAIVEALTKAK